MANLEVWERSDDDKIDLGKQICDLYKEGVYTIDGCCEAKGVKIRTFYDWVKRFAELAEYFAWSKRMSDGLFDATAKTLARKAVIRRLEGTERKTGFKLKFQGNLSDQEIDLSEASDFNELIKKLSELVEGGGKITVEKIEEQIHASDNLVLSALSNTDNWEK